MSALRTAADEYQEAVHYKACDYTLIFDALHEIATSQHRPMTIEPRHDLYASTMPVVAIFSWI
jgi:hypothetical protein